MIPFLLTVPHAGEKIPDQCPWLKSLPEPILMSDVDRYVDLLYTPAQKALGFPLIKTEWHRYAADLNRLPTDVDADSVSGNSNASGAFTRGFHWVKTFEGAPLMTAPMPQSDHEILVKLIHDPFHQQVEAEAARLKSASGVVYQIDAHSMPSVGTSEHRDPGQRRADIVVSDVRGQSADPRFVDLVMTSYCRAGFKVAYNWPYFGGRMTERYGRPSQGHHTVQVELNRGLYMDESTKKLRTDLSGGVSVQLQKALERILAGLSSIL